MNLETWLLFASAALVVILIPGPLSLLMVSNSLNYSNSSRCLDLILTPAPSYQSRMQCYQLLQQLRLFNCSNSHRRQQLYRHC